MADAVTARVDAGGRLIEADPRLAELQATAGGQMDGPVAVPALDSLVRLARSLGVRVARSVIVAEGDHDLELFARAEPDGTDVRLTLSGWVARPQRRPWLVTDETPNVPVSHAIADRFGWAADAGLILTGLTGLADSADWIGRPLHQFFRLIEDEAGQMPILAGLAGHRDFSGQRATLRNHPDQEVSFDGTVLRDDQGGFAGYSGAGHPVAPIAARPDPVPLVSAPAFVDRLDKALRAPLTRIAARADAIGTQADGPLRRDYADYAGDIGSAARHLLALVDDLADLQAIERPDFALAVEPIDLADVARRAAGLLQVRSGAKDVRIDRPADGETLAAQGDFRRVLQILVNLLGNAIRYAPEGSHIWLRTERDADTAVLVVADQGKGIAPEDQARIFEKFERVDPGEPEGSGLGLYISRQLARAMGGDITVDSAPGQGARFVLTLPAA